jgi:hypothetical protein
MRLEPLYRATFTTPESWCVELVGPAGTEARSFLIAEAVAKGGSRAVSGLALQHTAVETNPLVRVMISPTHPCSRQAKEAT